MEKLTCKFNEQNVLRAMCTFDRESTTEPDDCISCQDAVEEFCNNECENCEIQKAFDRLSEYESTNLAPKQIQEITKNQFDPIEMCKIHIALEKLKEYQEQIDKGLLLEIPCGVGEEVWVICECRSIPAQLDGTLYGEDGEPGTATGYYCPYEENCPHECDDFDCEKYKHKSAVFEDTVQAIYFSENGVEIMTDNCPVCSRLGEYIFLSEEEAKETLQKMEETK